MAKQPSGSASDLHQVLAALGDPIRLSIVRQLARRGEVACGDFAGVGVAKSTLSHHFKVLRDSGVIGTRAEGTSLMNYLEQPSLERRFPGLLAAILGTSGRRSASR